MIKPLDLIRATVIGVCTLLLAACGAPSVLIKPPANSIEKIALVHVSATRGLRNLNNTSSTGAITLVAGKGNNDSEDGASLANFAIDTFNDAFSKIGTWKIVDTSDVLASEAYRGFVKRSEEAMPKNKFVRSLISSGLSVPNGMAYLPGEGRDKAGMKSLAKLAQDLHVDAVVVMQLDMAYLPSASIAGIGSARAAVGMSVVAVTKDANYAIKLPSLQDQKAYNPNNPYRQRSEASVPMVAGVLVLASSEEIFRDSIRKDIIALRDNIDKELKARK